MFKRAIAHVVSCKEVSHLISQMQERRLGPIERWKLKMHLAWCVACARFDVQMRYLRRVMHKYRE